MHAIIYGYNLAVKPVAPVVNDISPFVVLDDHLDQCGILHYLYKGLTYSDRF